MGRSPHSDAILKYVLEKVVLKHSDETGSLCIQESVCIYV